MARKVELIVSTGAEQVSVQLDEYTEAEQDEIIATLPAALGGFPGGSFIMETVTEQYVLGEFALPLNRVVMYSPDSFQAARTPAA